MRFILKTLGAIVLAAILCAPSAPAADGSVVFLVRHAEKTSEKGYGPARDPRLTDAGRERAEALARVLAPAGITHVHSTDYRRTRETAAPVAEALGLEVRRYDARMLESFADELRGAPGRHLVVGHSNTTPRLVELLGGQPGGPIAEAWEYDRLYVLFLEPGGETMTVIQRYGRESVPDGPAVAH